MNPAIKGAIAFGTVAGAGGAGYGIYSATKTTPTITPQKQTTNTYADEFKGTLLSTTDENYKEKWGARLASLQGLPQDAKLVDVLKGLRPKDTTEQWKKLRTWCATIIKQPIKDKQSQEFDNVQNYCTYSVKEKLGDKVITEDTTADSTGKWTKAHSKLVAIDNSKLNQKLREAKEAPKDGKEKQKLKEWCDSVYSKPYKGEIDSDFSLAKQVCVSD